MELGLRGKRVFVTASARGIGLAMAEAFLREGARVIMNGRNEDTLKEAAGRLAARYGENIHYHTADMASKEGMDNICAFIRECLGGLDIFIANLGTGRPKSGNALEASEWKRFYDMNVMSTVSVLDRLYLLLKDGRNPCVTLISSVVSKEASSAPAGYAAAKSAVCVLNKYLSRMWAADGIRVNCVLPGNIYFEGGRWEELLKADADGVNSYICSAVPLKRFGKPEEIADIVVFLSSEQSLFTTGAEIAVDGGQLSSI